MFLGPCHLSAAIRKAKMMSVLVGVPVDDDRVAVLFVSMHTDIVWPFIFCFSHCVTQHNEKIYR